MITFAWEPVLMILLLAGSAFFSGTETAFFNLSRRQIAKLENSGSRLSRLVVELLAKPGQLLSCLLFGNMAVNVLFYAIASVFTIRLEQQFGIGVAVVFAGGSFAVLVLLGEILPKTLAYSNSRAISVGTSALVFLCLQIFKPVVFFFQFILVEPILRLLLGPAKKPAAITPGEFKLLVEQMLKHGQITADENRLLTEIIELGFLKVRDCLLPRVDMAACAVTDSNEHAVKFMRKNHLTKAAVYVEEIDNIVGLVQLRQLLLEPQTSVDRLVGPVNFVPEQKTIESLLEFFRKTGTDMAVVVDEYGGIAGSISLEDIAEELLGPIEVTGLGEPIEQIGTLEYRLAGDLAIHEWAASFGVDPAKLRVSTMAGLVTVLLGRIPKAGDIAHLKNLTFTVERVRKRRIETIILTLEPIPTNGQ